MFAGPLGLWIVCCLHLKKSSALALGGVNGVKSFITIIEQFNKAEGAIFSMLS